MIAPDAQAPARFAGRYLIGEPLKRGNGVDTFRAVDTLTVSDVVLKFIDPAVIHAAARLRFEHETQVLRQLHWPRPRRLARRGRGRRTACTSSSPTSTAAPWRRLLAKGPLATG